MDVQPGFVGMSPVGRRVQLAPPQMFLCDDWRGYQAGEEGRYSEETGIGVKANDEDRPEIFDCLGFVEADLDTLKQTVSELRDLTRIQVLSQLLTYCLFEANNTVRPPGFQEKIFGKDHLGEYEGLLGAVENEGEEDTSGEETETKYANTTLGREDDVVKEKDMVQDVERNEESETEVMVPNIVELEEPEELEETSGITSGEEEGLGGKSEEDGNYLPVKGKKSGTKVTKN
ncbi:hypothetical protein M422DRAFT_259681 [Sphaerobolus stellatus SS14]|uniref:Uncharacterized protein n=1 Tax=Sphaerobolus stellatus (strain SS14) TaxID=990650 RepID=A0A0C9USL8_SPHS4|nr:hypothetical protein M422DRAFT_259681 [Sphaerobolus stellatus SS14]